MNGSATVAQKALAAGTLVNDNSGVIVFPERLSSTVEPFNARHWFNGHTEYGHPRPPSFVLEPACVSGADITAVVICLVQAGASVVPLVKSDDGREMQDASKKRFSEFAKTPLAYAVAAFEIGYYQVLWEHRDEIAALGSSSSTLTLFKLAVASGDVAYARKRWEEHGCQGLQTRHVVKKLWKSARQTGNDKMMQWMRALILKHTRFASVPTEQPGCQIPLVELVHSMIEAGAPTDNIHDESWRRLWKFDKRVEYEMMRWHEDLDVGRNESPWEYGYPLEELALGLENSELLDIALQDHSEIAYDTPEAWEMQLECACRWGDATWAKIILDRGFDIREEEYGRVRPSRFLYLALPSLNPILIQTLLGHGARAAGLAAPGRRSLVGKAIMAGYKEQKQNLVAVLKLLLEAGADASSAADDIAAGYPKAVVEPYRYRQSDGFRHKPKKPTPRTYCQDALCQPGCLELLESYGASPLHGLNWLFLRSAIEENNIPLLQRLLEDGILNPYDPSTDAGICYCEACRNDLKKGPNVVYAALGYLRSKTHPDVAITMTRLLLKHGVDITLTAGSVITNAASYYKYSPECTLEVVRLLLDAGAYINGPKNECIAAIHAVKGTNLDLHKLLLERGASVSGERNGTGQNAAEVLCNFSKHGDRKVMQLFLDHDDELTANDELFQGVVEAACRSRNVPLLRTILMRKRVAPRYILGWALSTFSSSFYDVRWKVDARMLAFALDIGGVQDAVTAGKRTDVFVKFFDLMALEDEDLVMVALQCFHYCTDFHGTRQFALQAAASNNMMRVFDYLQQNPNCSSLPCNSYHTAP